MTDLDKLTRLVDNSLQDNNLTKFTCEVYKKLVEKFLENGFEIELSGMVSVKEENAILRLERHGYVKTQFCYHISDGFFYRIDLRGDKFQAHVDDFSYQSAMLDSGKREQFSTGAVRDASEDKQRPDLISPFAMERLGEWLRLGSTKYLERNWEQGIPVSRTTASLYRHLLKFQQGKQDEDHLAAIMCNAMMLIHTEEMVNRNVLPQELLDMPDYVMPVVHCNKDEAYDV